jgi:hypothetical protein
LADCDFNRDFNRAALHPASPTRAERARRERRHPKASTPRRASRLLTHQRTISVDSRHTQTSQNAQTPAIRRRLGERDTSTLGCPSTPVVLEDGLRTRAAVRLPAVARSPRGAGEAAIKGAQSRCNRGDAEGRLELDPHLEHIRRLRGDRRSASCRLSRIRARGRRQGRAVRLA